jgi:hypothetical protein
MYGIQVPISDYLLLRFRNGVERMCSNYLNKWYKAALSAIAGRADFLCQLS